MTHDDDELDADVGLRDELEGLLAHDELSDDLDRIASALERVNRRLAALIAGVVIGTATVALVVVLTAVWIIESRP